MADATASAAPVAAESVPATDTAASGAMPTFKGTKHKVKINGSESEVDYDELVSSYQLRQAADAKFQAAKKLHDEVQMSKKDIEAFTKDPWEFAKKHGLDPYQLAEQLLLQKLEYEGLSEPEKRALAAEQKAKELEADLENRTKAEREAARKQATAQAVKEIDEEIGAALQQLGRKPTPRLIARLAEQMLSHLESQDGQRPSAADALKRVDQEFLGDLHEYLENLPAERYSELPQKFRDALRKSDVDRVLAQDPKGSRRKVVEAAPRREKVQRMTTDEYFKQKLERKFGA